MINGKRYVISIDGRAASGKTTLANQLSLVFNAPVVHADDFFLPLELRTESRLLEKGGNIHYERMKEEVIDKCVYSSEFCYTRFDCKTKSLADKIFVPESSVIIIEGSYSHHPYFGKYADLKLFKTIDPKTQWERILKRNGVEWGEMFRTKWIPLEEAYFKEYAVKEHADIVLGEDALFV